MARINVVFNSVRRVNLISFHDDGVLFRGDVLIGHNTPENTPLCLLLFALYFLRCAASVSLFLQCALIMGRRMSP